MFSQRFLRHPRAPSNEHVLPTPAHDRHDRRTRRSCACCRLPHNRRYTRIGLFLLISCAVVAIVRSAAWEAAEDAYVPLVEDPPENHIFPPLYPAYHEQELRLPQHSQDGRDGKYVFFANHVHASGWGNAMQELLFNSYLAYSAGRHFVFDNYTWNRDGSDYTDYNGKLIPSRIPHTVMIRGPTVGDPFPPGIDAPLAVVKEYFDKVCPDPTIIDSDIVTRNLPNDASAQAVLDAWVEKLHELDDHPCIEFDRQSAQIFTIWIFGSKRVLDIFPGFAKSPIMTGFRWSPLIESAFENNRPLISPLTFYDKHLSSLPFLRPTIRYPMIPGLLVLHIRRGDFSEHCAHLARWSSTFNGFNSFPELPDQFEPPPGAGWGENTPENTALYMQRCFPSIEQIATKVAAVRETDAGRGLRNVYIMTNGAREWVEELKAALFALGGFERVTGSRDVKLSWEQKYVAQAVDMLIGQRAQVLVGNGFSSLTSNIVMMRMANGFAPDSNRFW